MPTQQIKRARKDKGLGGTERTMKVSTKTGKHLRLVQPRLLLTAFFSYDARVNPGAADAHPSNLAFDAPTRTS